MTELGMKRNAMIAMKNGRNTGFGDSGKVTVFWPFFRGIRSGDKGEKR
jgi:hypothetical protein